MAEDATVVDWEGNVLREGSNGYTCFPTPPMLTGTAPMCMDAEWMEWADAWSNEKAFEADTLGISYMLAGDESASNIDPYAEGLSDDKDRRGRSAWPRRFAGHSASAYTKST